MADVIRKLKYAYVRVRAGECDCEFQLFLYSVVAVVGRWQLVMAEASNVERDER